MYKLISSSLLFAGVFTTSVGLAKTQNPSQWKRIYPVKDCINFHLVYVKQGNQYYITYPYKVEGGQEHYKNPYITVKSINDLSSIADVIAAEADRRCPQKVEPAHGTDSCNALDNLDPDFIKLVQDAANAVGKTTKDKCKELTRYMELHDKITELDPKNPVQIEKASNVGNAILKIFASSTDDKLIDHFESCGGKSKSHIFVANLLLVESHKSCIMPKPPGILSWNEMRNIAAKIGARYVNKSILNIRDNKDEIEKDALIEITHAASINQIKELMPHVFAERALAELDSYQNLKKARKLSDLKNYIKLVYTPNASIEIAEKSLEGVVLENMREKLPADWPEAKKKRYINDVLMPKAKAGFNECMEEPKKRSNYGHKADPQINLNYRKWQRDEFCKQHKSVCIKAEKPGCSSGGASVNVLSMSPKVTDADLAKSCVMNGMARTIEPIFGLVMSTTVDGFKDDVKLPDGLAARFSESAWKQFKGCINTHELTAKQFKGTTYQPIYHPSGTNPDAFFKMSPEEFKQLYGDCSANVEQQLTKDFVEVVFISNENVVENNPHGPMVEFHGNMYPAGAVSYARETVKKNLDRCFERQESFNKDKKDFKANPALCSPMLEIEVARSIINKKLQKMFEDKKLTKDKEAQKIIAEFRSCSARAYEETANAAGDPNATPKLMDPQDVKPYMENNKTFYNCVQGALVDTARLIAGREYRTAIWKKKSELKNYTSIMGMEGSVKSVVAKCFETELSKSAGSWPKFKDFNAAEGIAAAEEKCGKAANKYAIPRIMMKETYSQIEQVKKDGLLSSGKEIEEIMLKASDDIKSTFGIRLNQGNQKSSDYMTKVFAEGLTAYLAKNPKAKEDDYLEWFKKKVTARVIEKVHDKLMMKIKVAAKSRFNMDLFELDDKMPASCMLDLYETLTKNPSPSKKKSSDPLNLDELTDQVVEGFNYLKKLPPPAFQQQMDKIGQFCKNAKSYTSEESIKRSGLLDFIVKAQIYDKTAAAFRKMAMETYNDEIKKYKGKPYFQQVKPFIDKKLNDMLSLISDKLENRAAFEALMFPGGSSPIIDFAIANAEDATKEGSSANKKLNELVMAQLFKDRSRYSFASKFSEIQIVNSVGMEGYEEAELGIYASLKKHPNIPSLVLKEAKKSLNRNWTVKKVHDRIFWYDLPDFARQDLMKSVYDNAILPTVRGESKVSLAKSKKKLGDRVSSHLENWHKDGKTFKEVFTEEIERETTAEIKANHKWDAASEAVGRWFSW